jgi:anti-sigma factor RsiW
MMPDKISCQTCRERLPEFAAGTLPEAARMETAEHLRTCPQCSAELERWQSIGQALRETAVPPPLLTFEAAWGNLQAQLAASSNSRIRTHLLPDRWRGVSSMDHRSTIFLPDSAGWSDEGPTQPRIPRTPTPRSRWRLLAACAAVLALMIASAGIFATIAAQRGHATSGVPTVRPATSTHPVATNSTPPTPTGSPGVKVEVFFSRHPESDNNPDDVFPVMRVAPNLQVATFAMNQLISGPTATEQEQGYYTPLQGGFSGASNCGGADFQITLNHRGNQSETGTATLQFCRQLLLAGDLTGPRITAEITSTLEQFSSIRRVVILNQSGACFDDFSGQNRCLSA